MNKDIFIDYPAAKNCQNKEESYGMICVKCGQCGRKFNKKGTKIKNNPKEKPLCKQ